MQTSRGKIKVGDRVLIFAKDHPWVGNAGHITGEKIPATNQWVIELDNGLKAAAKEAEFMPMSDITVGGVSEENR